MDLIADTLTILTNGQRARKKRVAVPYSKFKQELLGFLKEKQVIEDVRVQESPKAKLVVTLAYDNDIPRIQGAKRLSSPGRRLYRKHSEMPYRHQNVGCIIVSTSEGLMDEKQARGKKVGGELVCSIW